MANFLTRSYLSTEEAIGRLFGLCESSWMVRLFFVRFLMSHVWHGEESGNQGPIGRVE